MNSLHNYAGNIEHFPIMSRAYDQREILQVNTSATLVATPAGIKENEMQCGEIVNVLPQMFRVQVKVSREFRANMKQDF